MPRTSGPTESIEAMSKSEVQHIIRCEIARLDNRFSVNADPTSHQCAKVTKLVCSIIDQCLPSVPCLHVTIPADYPSSSPTCTFLEHEINSTKFFNEVQDSFAKHVAQLPTFYTLSHLLETWELAIRHACSPNKNTKVISSLSVALGI